MGAQESRQKGLEVTTSVDASGGDGFPGSGKSDAAGKPPSSSGQQASNAAIILKSINDLGKSVSEEAVEMALVEAGNNRLQAVNLLLTRGLCQPLREAPRPSRASTTTDNAQKRGRDDQRVEEEREERGDSSSSQAAKKRRREDGQQQKQSVSVSEKIHEVLGSEIARPDEAKPLDPVNEARRLAHLAGLEKGEPATTGPPLTLPMEDDLALLLNPNDAVTVSAAASPLSGTSPRAFGTSGTTSEGSGGRAAARRASHTLTATAEQAAQAERANGGAAAAAAAGKDSNAPQRSWSNVVARGAGVPPSAGAAPPSPHSSPKPSFMTLIDDAGDGGGEWEVVGGSGGRRGREAQGTLSGCPKINAMGKQAWTTEDPEQKRRLAEAVFRKLGTDGWDAGVVMNHVKAVLKAVSALEGLPPHPVEGAGQGPSGLFMSTLDTVITGLKQVTEESNKEPYCAPRKSDDCSSTSDDYVAGPPPTTDAAAAAAVVPQKSPAAGGGVGGGSGRPAGRGRAAEKELRDGLQAAVKATKLAAVTMKHVANVGQFLHSASRGWEPQMQGLLSEAATLTDEGYWRSRLEGHERDLETAKRSKETADQSIERLIGPENGMRALLDGLTDESKPLLYLIEGRKRATHDIEKEANDLNRARLELKLRKEITALCRQIAESYSRTYRTSCQERIQEMEKRAVQEEEVLIAGLKATKVAHVALQDYLTKKLKKAGDQLERQTANLEEHEEMLGEDAPETKKGLESLVREMSGVCAKTEAARRAHAKSVLGMLKWVSIKVKGLPSAAKVQKVADGVLEGFQSLVTEDGGAGEASGKTEKLE